MSTRNKGFLLRDVGYTVNIPDIPKLTDIEIIRSEKYRSLVTFKYRGTINWVWVRNTDIALDTMDVLPLTEV